MQNDVPQGLSSSIFTLNVREAERFLSAVGIRLRDRERQYRHVGRGDRRSVWRREGDGRRARVRLGRVEAVHAARDQHHQLRDGVAAGAGCQFRHRLTVKSQRCYPFDLTADTPPAHNPKPINNKAVTYSSRPCYCSAKSGEMCGGVLRYSNFSNATLLTSQCSHGIVCRRVATILRAPSSICIVRREFC